MRPRVDWARLLPYALCLLLLVPFGVMAAVAAWTCREPIEVPATLRVAEGSLVRWESLYTRRRHLRRHVSGVRLWLDSSPDAFTLSSIMGDPDATIRELRVGARVSLAHDDVERPSVWSLNVDGKALLEVAEAKQRLDRNRRIGLYLALAFGSVFVAGTGVIWYLWWQGGWS